MAPMDTHSLQSYVPDTEQVKLPRFVMTGSESLMDVMNGLTPIVPEQVHQSEKDKFQTCCCGSGSKGSKGS